MLKMEGRGRFVMMVGLLVVAFVPAHCDESAKPVSTVLRASWQDTPLLLEARYTGPHDASMGSWIFEI